MYVDHNTNCPIKKPFGVGDDMIYYEQIRCIITESSFLEQLQGTINSIRLGKSLALPWIVFPLFWTLLWCLVDSERGVTG